MIGAAHYSPADRANIQAARTWLEDAVLRFVPGEGR